MDTTAQTRKHADGRTRFHGQMQRGRPTKATEDAADITEVLRAVPRGRDGLLYYASPEVQAMPRIQREGVKRAALSHIDRAKRHLEEVLERHGYEADLARAAPRPRGE